MMLAKKTLAELNPHSRDARIEFKEEEHIYILDGKYVFPRSVSRLVGESFDEFDAPAVARRCLRKWRADSASKYHLLIAACDRELPAVDPARLICAAWGANGSHKSELGRMMHLSIELTLNEVDVASVPSVETTGFGDTDDLPERAAPSVIKELCSETCTNLRPEEARAVVRLALKGELSNHTRVPVKLPICALDSVEMRAWMAWRTTAGSDLAPLRTEWSIYSTQHQIAGQIDAVFRCRSSGKIVLVDWKRVTDLERTPLRDLTDKTRGKYGKSPLENVPDTKYWHYALQVNLYSHLLSKFYRVQIGEMRLVQIHPSLPAPGFAEHRIDFLPPETLEALLNRPF